MPFFLLLLFASWGIGKVVSETHSLLLCAAFHGIANFSRRDLFLDTTFTVAFICVIVFWIVMWYYFNHSDMLDLLRFNISLSNPVTHVENAHTDSEPEREAVGKCIEGPLIRRNLPRPV